MTSTSLQQLFDKDRSKGLLVDSNLLLLYFIGRVDPDLIAEFKALRSHRFTADDFNYLSQIIHQFRTSWTCGYCGLTQLQAEKQ